MYLRGATFSVRTVDQKIIYSNFYQQRVSSGKTTDKEDIYFSCYISKLSINVFHAQKSKQ